MKKRKIFLSLFVCIFMLLGCSKEESNSVITIKKSDEAKTYEEETLTKYNNKQYFTEDYFDTSIEQLSSRTEQVFPECQLNNTLGFEEFEDNKVYTLTSDNYENIILYIHGGAWIFEMNLAQVSFCDELASRLNAKVYMPLYPLAPKSNCIETMSFIEDLYKEILKENKTLYVMGDSAGGNIALNLMYTIKQEGLTNPNKLVVMAPVSDLTFSNLKSQEINETDHELDLYGLKKSAILWAGEDNLTNPKYSPLYADVQGYPDTMLVQGTNDVLYPDNLILYQNMKDAGVNVTLVEGEDLWHVFPVFSIPEKEETLKLIKEFCAAK